MGKEFGSAPPVGETQENQREIWKTAMRALLVDLEKTNENHPGITKYNDSFAVKTRDISNDGLTIEHVRSLLGWAQHDPNKDERPLVKYSLPQTARQLWNHLGNESKPLTLSSEAISEMCVDSEKGGWENTIGKQDKLTADIFSHNIRDHHFRHLLQSGQLTEVVDYYEYARQKDKANDSGGSNWDNKNYFPVLVLHQYAIDDGNNVEIFIKISDTFLGDAKQAFDSEFNDGLIQASYDLLMNLVKNNDAGKGKRFLDWVKQRKIDVVRDGGTVKKLIDAGFITSQEEVEW